MEPTVLSNRFLTSQTLSGFIAAKLQTLREATAARAWYSR